MNENKGRNKGWDNLIPCKPGETANPNGRPKGQRNYATLRALAITNLAKKKGMAPEEIEVLLHENGIARAINGDYRFYRDDVDRIHGTAVQNQKIEHSGSVDSTVIVPKEDIMEIAKRVAEELKVKKTNGNPNEGTASGS